MADFILVGPGRAGMSVAWALRRSGHRAGGVLGRDPAGVARAAAELDTVPLEWDRDLPAADLLIVAVRDDAIAQVAERLAGWAEAVTYAVHLSGLTPAAALAPLARSGTGLGALHPLQTLPDPASGAAALPGCWMAVTAEDPALRGFLEGLVRSIGARPFVLDDTNRALYHAAAACASNYLITTLALAHRLFAAAAVPFDVARPLVRAVVDNAFTLGPRAALTGPVARADVATVRGQLTAIELGASEALADFIALGRATARLAGTVAAFEDVW